MTQSLAELEQLCNVLYNSHNPNERAHAEGVLRPFSTNPEYIPQCKVRPPSRMRWFFFARAHPFNNTRLTVGRRAGEADPPRRETTNDDWFAKKKALFVIPKREKGDSLFRLT